MCMFYRGTHHENTQVKRHKKIKTEEKKRNLI